MDWTQTFAIIGVCVALLVYMVSLMDPNQKENSKNFEAMNSETC